MRTLITGVVLFMGACAAGDAPPLQVVPQAEQERARALGSAGPVANRGIESITNLGTVPLAGEIQGAGDRVLRVREIVVAPGGVVAVHQHEGRPGVAYIVDGEMTEFRGERPQPLVKRRGEVALEQTGVTHWWENRGATPARALVVDIVPAPGK